MTVPAPRGASNRTPGREQGHQTYASQSEACPDFGAIAQDLGRQHGLQLGKQSVRRMYRFYLAQASAEAGFVEWLLTYLDPTGEQATNNVLWDDAKAVAA